MLATTKARMVIMRNQRPRRERVRLAVKAAIGGNNVRRLRYVRGGLKLRGIHLGTAPVAVTTEMTNSRPGSDCQIPGGKGSRWRSTKPVLMTRMINALIV